MKKYTNYFLVLLLISVTFVGYVRLADPGMDSPTPEVQQNAEPHEQAATAVRKLSAVDSQITITETRNGSEVQRALVLISPDQGVMKVEEITGGEYGAYYTDGGMWFRSEQYPSWHYRSTVGYHPEANPFDPSRIETTPADNVTQRNGTLILEYTETLPHLFLITEFRNYYSGGMSSVKIRLDTSTYRVSRIDVQLENGDGNATLSYEFEYRDVDVERPSGVPRVSLKRLVNDFHNVYRKIHGS